MATETDTTTTAEHRSTGALAETFPLGMQWPTLDPFLFLAHHRDAYPAGTTELGPDAPLDGREIGSDFSGKDGWSMYHGSRAPGFPAHPHRGFETVTYVREGLIDHSDSLGATARFGRGDTQWMTAGSGIVHSEMFPLVNEDSDNPTELFQIWLNLPAGSKMADPYFTMLWGPEIPEVRFGGDGAAGTTVTVIAGDLQDAAAPAAPPDSWASRSDSAVAIWHIRMDPGARWTLPAAPSITDGARPAPPIRGCSMRSRVTVLQSVEVCSKRATGRSWGQQERSTWKPAMAASSCSCCRDDHSVSRWRATGRSS